MDHHRMAQLIVTILFVTLLGEVESLGLPHYLVERKYAVSRPTDLLGRRPTRVSVNLMIQSINLERYKQSLITTGIITMSYMDSRLIDSKRKEWLESEFGTLLSMKPYTTQADIFWMPQLFITNTRGGEDATLDDWLLIPSPNDMLARVDSITGKLSVSFPKTFFTHCDVGSEYESSCKIKISSLMQDHTEIDFEITDSYTEDEIQTNSNVSGEMEYGESVVNDEDGGEGDLPGTESEEDEEQCQFIQPSLSTSDHSWIATDCTMESRITQQPFTKLNVAELHILIALRSSRPPSTWSCSKYEEARTCQTSDDGHPASDDTTDGYPWRLVSSSAGDTRKSTARVVIKILCLAIITQYLPGGPNNMIRV